MTNTFDIMVSNALTVLVGIIMFKGSKSFGCHVGEHKAALASISIKGLGWSYSSNSSCGQLTDQVNKAELSTTLSAGSHTCTHSGVLLDRDMMTGGLMDKRSINE